MNTGWKTPAFAILAGIVMLLFINTVYQNHREVKLDLQRDSLNQQVAVLKADGTRTDAQNRHLRDSVNALRGMVSEVIRATRILHLHDDSLVRKVDSFPFMVPRPLVDSIILSKNAIIAKRNSEAFFWESIAALQQEHIAKDTSLLKTTRGLLNTALQQRDQYRSLNHRWRISLGVIPGACVVAFDGHPHCGIGVGISVHR